MKKFGLIRLPVLIFIFVFLSGITALAMNDSPEVEVVIESYDKTLAKGSVFASSFLEAVQKLGKDAGISVVVSKTADKDEIHSVNGITNNYVRDKGEWLGFIIREGKIIEEKDFDRIKLCSGDTAVLFYGDAKTTKIAGKMEFLENGADVLNVKISGERVVWKSENGKIVSETIAENIKGAKVHLKSMDGREQVSLTSDSGEAVFNGMEAGLYSCYAEGYNTAGLPVIVKAQSRYVLFGVENPESVTRAEFAAIAANCKKPEASGVSVNMKDISGTRYEKEIILLASGGYVSGYDDGTFKPGKPVTLLEGVVILSRFLNDEAAPETDASVPDWAGKGIASAKANGLLKGISEGYFETINSEIMEKLILNMK